MDDVKVRFIEETRERISRLRKHYENSPLWGEEGKEKRIDALVEREKILDRIESAFRKSGGNLEDPDTEEGRKQWDKVAKAAFDSAIDYRNLREDTKEVQPKRTIEDAKDYLMDCIEAYKAQGKKHPVGLTFAQREQLYSLQRALEVLGQAPLEPWDDMENLPVTHSMDRHTRHALAPRKLANKPAFLRALISRLKEDPGTLFNVDITPEWYKFILSIAEEVLGEDVTLTDIRNALAHFQC